MDPAAEECPLEKVPELCTDRRRVYTGPIENLAEKVGFLQCDSRGHPIVKKAYELGIPILDEKDRGYLFFDARGNIVCGRELGFCVDVTRTVFKEQGLIDGTELGNDDESPRRYIEFRTIPPGDELARNHLINLVRSSRRGALALQAAVYRPLNNNRWSKCWPGFKGIPLAGGDQRPFLHVWYSHVLSDSDFICKPGNDVVDVLPVLEDIKWTATGDESPCQWDYTVNKDCRIGLKFLVGGVKEWVVHNLEESLRRVIAHPDFQVAVQQHARIRHIKFPEGSSYDPRSALVAAKPVPTGIPRDWDSYCAALTTLDYKPRIDNIAAAVNNDPDLRTLIQLL